MNNKTSVAAEGSNQPETLYLSDLDTQMQVTLSVILGIACPLGLSMEFYLILKLLKKGGKGLWDHLTLALEALALCSHV